MYRTVGFTRKVGEIVACMAIVVARIASAQFCIIFYQDEIPEAVKKLAKKDK